MDYHADRFHDASLVFCRGDDIVAVLPQTLHTPGKVGKRQWRSHGGLTYGGLILAPSETMREVSQMFDLIADQAKVQDVAVQTYTPVPHIYHVQRCEEDRHALFRAGAVLQSSKLDSVIDLGRPLPRSSLRIRGIRKAAKAQLTAKRGGNVDEFHAILQKNLSERHNTRPVHSAQEMTLLQSRFPHNICTYSALDQSGKMVAGLWVFDTAMCRHLQYIAATPPGRESGAVDMLVDRAIAEAPAGVRYFSFGTSNEDDGRVLNEGLLAQKAMFGARGVVYETWLRTF